MRGVLRFLGSIATLRQLLASTGRESLTFWTQYVLFLASSIWGSCVHTPCKIWFISLAALESTKLQWVSLWTTQISAMGLQGTYLGFLKKSINWLVALRLQLRAVRRNYCNASDCGRRQAQVPHQRMQCDESASAGPFPERTAQHQQPSLHHHAGCWYQLAIDSCTTKPLSTISRDRSNHQGAEHEAERNPAAGRGSGRHTPLRDQEGGCSEDHPEEGNEAHWDRQGTFTSSSFPLS